MKSTTGDAFPTIRNSISHIKKICRAAAMLFLYDENHFLHGGMSGHARVACFDQRAASAGQA
jgi:hypothetical protein